MSTRLWGGSFGAAMALHGGAALAALLWLQTPKLDLPAGAFAVELANFGGAPGAAGGGAPAKPAPPPPPQPEVKPQPAPEAAKPPVVEPEVALPKPKPEPKPQPKAAPKPVAKPAPQPQPKPAPPAVAAAAPEPSAPAPSAPSAALGEAGGAAAPGPAEGSAGSPIAGRLGAGGVDAGSPLGRYKAQVYHALWKNRRYPPVAQRMGYEGEVEVTFTVAADGGIRNVRITRESDYGVLNREVESLLDRIRRFPPFPADLPAQSLTFRIAIPFKLS